jgi:carboxymethylenebutenolidase
MVQAYWSDDAPVGGYLARPAAGPPRGGVIMCPDQEGATDAFAGLTRRLGKDGYVALLVDPLSDYGGSAAVPERERAALYVTPGAAARRAAQIGAAAAFLEREAGVPAGVLGLLGIGFGGLDAWAAACTPDGPAPAVVLFGTRPAALLGADQVRAAVQLHYGARDRTAMADLPALERQLRDAGGVYALRVHAGLGRRFWYEQGAAEAAWRAMLAWFDGHLPHTAPRNPPWSAAGPSTAPRPN